MFASAYKKAINYTKPVIISTRNQIGEVNCACGSYILLNKDGWILTVAHLLDSFIEFQKNKDELDKYDKEVERINNDNTLNTKKKRKKINNLDRNPKWITNLSFWWGADEITINKFHFYYPGDIAIGKIENYKPADNTIFPKLKNPKKMDIATSLCKLGFPFHDIKATFTEKTKSFVLADGTLPLPFFPIEGIYTRNVYVNNPIDKKGFSVKFIETSSPGLRGQSGGPIFDSSGTIWGVQSRTQHFPLGFSPKINGVEENQFLNVGLGLHPEFIMEFLNKYKVDFELVD